MPNPIVGSIASSVISGVMSSRASGQAADAQVEASEAGIAEEQRQFERTSQLLAPFVGGGLAAFADQGALIGLGTPQQQEYAIKALEESPQFQSLIRTGEEALLQNASATGGLRGGNLQGALAQYRPQILSQLIESQFNKLGQISNIGQSSAARQAAAGQASASNIANLLGQQGAAVAGGKLAQGQALSGIASNIGQGILLSNMGQF